MDVGNSQGGDHPTNDEEEYKRKKEDKMFAKLYDIFFPSDQQQHQQQQPPSSQQLITTTTVTTVADRGGPRKTNLGWTGVDPNTLLGPALVADQILPQEAPPLPEPAVVEVAAAADLAEQTRQQEEEASNLRKIKSLEAEQRLLLWECYCLHNLRKMQQANRHGRNPQPASATPIRKKKRSEKRESVYMVPGSNIKAVDRWAWRKYGQKPIKGTYFPRSYYKCSTYRGCKAKKQVEQVLLDPEVYMVTYKGEHVHPNPVQLAHLPGPVHSSHPLCDLPNRFLLPPTQDQLPPPPPPPPSEMPFQQTPPPYEHPLGLIPPPQETVSVAAGEEEELLIPNLMVDEDIMSYWKRCTDLSNGPSSSASGSGSSGPGFY